MPASAGFFCCEPASERQARPSASHKDFRAQSARHIRGSGVFLQLAPEARDRAQRKISKRWPTKEDVCGQMPAASRSPDRITEMRLPRPSDWGAQTLAHLRNERYAARYGVNGASVKPMLGAA